MAPEASKAFRQDHAQQQRRIQTLPSWGGCKTSTMVEFKRLVSVDHRNVRDWPKPPVTSTRSVLGAAQLELADADGEVDTGLGLQAEWLEGESL
ncbi:hypothetical protein MesoLj113a_21830 [Mesorhizobium sp. 113-1-2]|nr:hypothetical protein MesoLj113a_21830 [Mesorhizobium sp. 113-1-2]